MVDPEIFVFAPDVYAESAAELVAGSIAESVRSRGRCRLGLAGGGTPVPVYERLAQPPLVDRVPWSDVDWFWGDERAVPPDDPASTYAMARRSLLDPVAAPAEMVHRIRGELGAHAAARAYVEVLGDEPIDVLLLGMGGDGHTASLFPETSAATSPAERVIATTSPVAPHDRISLAVSAINEARVVVLLVTGASKAQAAAATLLEHGHGLARAAHARSTHLAARHGRGRDTGGHAMTAQGTSQFGMIGMAVMGRNLAFNLLDHDFSVAVYNLEPEMMESAVAESGGKLHGTRSLQELVSSLERPRKIMMMIKAGKPVDIVLDQLAPLLDPGDIVIDGGNSWYEDTRRREKTYADAGFSFFGVGVSGGEDGARHGPSLMPGGDATAYKAIAPMFSAIAAKTDSGPCVTHVGPDGAGHFVKMVHNGIEYADMQFIAEAYHILSAVGGLAPAALADVFAAWNRGPLESFLIEITAQIFTVRDPKRDGFLIDSVLDKAGQKGTGRWTAQVAIEHGVPIPSIVAAIDARVLSSIKSERVRASEVLSGPQVPAYGGTTEQLVGLVHDALYAAKIVAYAQGMDLIGQLSRAHDWSIDLREVARIWKGGCIIRARFLDTIMGAYERNAALPNLLLDDELREGVQQRQKAWRDVVGIAQQAGIPVSGLATGLGYFDSYRSAHLPQNLTQAQRDAFGAHTYQRKDDPTGPFTHTDWLD